MTIPTTTTTPTKATTTPTTLDEVWWNKNNDDNDNQERIRLPKGADGIIRTIVAQEIFLKWVTACYKNQQQRHKRQDQSSSKLQEYSGTNNDADATSAQRMEQESSTVPTTVCSEDDDDTSMFRDIHELIQQYPGICHHTFEFQLDDNETRYLYPLAMVCCLEKAPMNLIQTAHQANPQALHHAESIKGCRPLHYACSFRASLAVVSFLIAQDVEGITVPRRDQMLPLHLAVYFLAPDEVTNYLLDVNPNSVFQSDDGFWGALHAAAACGKASLGIVSRLYNMNPGCILQVDNKGRTPLHLACWQRGNLPVVQFLLERAPQALYMEDVRLESCLFRAARSQNKQVLEVLLQHGHRHLAAGAAAAGAARQDDGNGGHANNNIEQQEQQQQQQQQARPPPPPNAGTAAPLPLPPTDDLGATLLHFAALDNTPAVVEYLINCYPSMVTTQTQDRDEYLPLHTAVHFHAPLKNIELLVEHDPQTLLTPNGHGAIALDLVHKRNSSRATTVDITTNTGQQPENGGGVILAQDCAKTLKCLALSVYLKDATKNAQLASECMVE